MRSRTRHREQHGSIVRKSGRWYLRYWEKRNIGGTIHRKRITVLLGTVTTRGKTPPGDIKDEAARHMATLNTCTIPAERIVTVGDFVESAYLPWIRQYKRPSTVKGYSDIWRLHLKPVASDAWLKSVRNHVAQTWLDTIGKSELGRNSLKHIKSVGSAIFKLAKQQGYFEHENPFRDTAINPRAAAPSETYAYDLDEIMAMLAVVPEPGATAIALAGFQGLTATELQGLDWPDLRDGDICISRDMWNGHITPPKTVKRGAPVPLISLVANRLAMHRLQSKWADDSGKEMVNPQTGPVFRNSIGNREFMNNILNRVILPALNRCEVCRASESEHNPKDRHAFKRDEQLPQWRGWHALRRALASNLNRLGVDDSVIQRIMRHSNVAVTQGCYIKTADKDMKGAMARLEGAIPEPPKSLRDTYGTPDSISGEKPTVIN